MIWLKCGILIVFEKSLLFIYGKLLVYWGSLVFDLFDFFVFMVWNILLIMKFVLEELLVFICLIVVVNRFFLLNMLVFFVKK